MEASLLASQEAGGLACSTLRTLFPSARKMEDLALERRGFQHSPWWCSERPHCKDMGGPDQGVVPANTASHVLEGDRSLAAARWGHKSNQEGSETQADRVAPISGKKRGAFPAALALAASPFSFPPGLLLGTR